MNTSEKQDLSSLRFCLYDRPLHPELFNIYHDHKIVKGGYEAQIWITGCAHVIGFFRGKKSMVEVTAGVDTSLPPRGRLLEIPFRGERDHEQTQVGQIRYMMNFQVEQMSSLVYEQTHHDLEKYGVEKGLFVSFPSWSSNSLAPFTCIDYEAGANELHVFAFHTFPEESTIVKTQSLFELA